METEKKKAVRITALQKVVRFIQVSGIVSLVVLLLFSWMAYNGHTTPFERIEVAALNDEVKHMRENVQNIASMMAEISDAAETVRAIEDNGVIPAVDKLKKEVSELHKKVKK